MIPVADAPIGSWHKPTEASSAAAQEAVVANSGRLTGREKYYVYLLWLNLLCFMGVFSAASAPFSTMFLLGRYLLWPMIIAGVVAHIATRGSQKLLMFIAPLMPFFAIGIVAGLIGYDPISSMRLLIFWFLGILSAAVIAAELPARTALRAVFWVMLTTLAASVVFVIVFPKTSVGLDTRGYFGGGSWSGIFAGKNALGWFAGYALILAVFSGGTNLVWRLVLWALLLVCLLFSGSQGSIVISVATAAFMGVIWLLRRTSLSPGARAATLLTLVLIVIPVLISISGLLLTAIGRDPTLTGRTDIWRLFGGRALEYWAIGAGPGSFSTGSPITADLSVALTSLGQIYTPHNMFIATLGEVGIFGLIASVGFLGYVAFVLPFRNLTSGALPASAASFMLLIGGIGETREVFGAAFAIFVILLLFSLARKAVASSDAKAEPAADVVGGQGDSVAILGAY